MTIVEHTEMVKIRHGFQKRVLQSLNRPSQEAQVAFSSLSIRLIHRPIDSFGLEKILKEVLWTL